ncbi:hypothetical protein PUN28_016155 [Cardiocondyla obscurior]|uniref:Uncharacterized protein n=1 Tax=Cardiocondyla obscurior TaxID=286306 RepID=A0AAW2ER97_9HYME
MITTFVLHKILINRNVAGHDRIVDDSVENSMHKIEALIGNSGYRRNPLNNITRAGRDFAGELLFLNYALQAGIFHSWEITPTEVETGVVYARIHYPRFQSTSNYVYNLFKQTEVYIKTLKFKTKNVLICRLSIELKICFAQKMLYVYRDCGKATTL